MYKRVVINAVHESLAWAGLAFVAMFLFTSIATVSEGVGYLPLLAGVGCAAALMVFRTDHWRALRVRRSTIVLLAFFAWFLFRLIVDYGDGTRIKAVTVGTSGGIVFALCLGAMTSLFVQTLGRKQTAWLVAAFFAGLALLLANAYAVHLAHLRADIFLIGDVSGLYQRPGNFLIIVALVASLLLTVNRNVATVALYLGLAVGMLPMTQLIGSNAAFVVVAAVCGGTLLWVLLVRSRWFERRRGRWNHRFAVTDFTLRAAPRIGLHAAWLAAVAVVGAILVLGRLGLETEHFRIFGFQQSNFGSSSLVSRIEILTTNFIDQLAVAPIFGNLNADALTTGRGSYAHSVLSIASHLGLLGMLLFALYGWVVYREFRHGNTAGGVEWDRIERKILRLTLIAVIGGFALVGTFFTWMPLWFAIGLLFPPLVLHRAMPVSSEPSKQEPDDVDEHRG